ncbi:hypothetical protein FHK94_18020 [Cylindrospermopsis raciborskii CS-506_D]|uniref:hypothetical protein n=1 Tax=Cylindrospermopsis raciborskii TaxID=77022 RepID=UPI0015A6FCF0|nr:hypothetical protein [Cylindrospermopsis raciborskii]MBA4451206.1 hypothetical protein [Cylindrospermopsis raciborskii CS-506_D]
MINAIPLIFGFWVFSTSPRKSDRLFLWVIMQSLTSGIPNWTLNRQAIACLFGKRDKL